MSGLPRWAAARSSQMQTSSVGHVELTKTIFNRERFLDAAVMTLRGTVSVPATVGCRAHVMKTITDLLRRVLQGSQPGPNTQTPIMADHRDRSSMADFVRILQAQDRQQSDRNSA